MSSIGFRTLLKKEMRRFLRVPAQTLAQQLNSTTQGIQSLRTNVNQDIGTSVSQANENSAQERRVGYTRRRNAVSPLKTKCS